jgi:hypothetical protein
LKPGDVVIGVLAGAVETKARPAVVIASEEYLRQRPDALVGIVTTRMPVNPASSDCYLSDWKRAGLRAESWFRTYILTVRREDVYVVGRLSPADWDNVQASVRRALSV